MAKDILLDEDGDLMIKNGDFVIGESLHQDAELLLQLTKGQVKADPLIGPDLITFLKSGNKEAMKKAIETVFNRDGKRAKNITISGGNITLTPKYK